MRVLDLQNQDTTYEKRVRSNYDKETVATPLTKKERLNKWCGIIIMINSIYILLEKMRAGVIGGEGEDMQGCTGLCAALDRSHKTPTKSENE